METLSLDLWRSTSGNNVLEEKSHSDVIIDCDLAF